MLDIFKLLIYVQGWVESPGVIIATSRGSPRVVGIISSVLGSLVTMEHFMGKQSRFCVKDYYKIRRFFRCDYGSHDLKQCPSESLIRSWVRKFVVTGSNLNEKLIGP